jgi:hypothetical protein
MSRAAGRARRQLAASLRTSWRAAALAFAAGLVLQVLLPVSDLRLVALAAAALAVAALTCLSVGAQRAPIDAPEPGTADRASVVERSTTLEQFGHAFLLSALWLGALGLGLWVGQAFGW